MHVRFTEGVSSGERLNIGVGNSSLAISVLPLVAISRKAVAKRAGMGMALNKIEPNDQAVHFVVTIHF